MPKLKQHLLFPLNEAEWDQEYLDDIIASLPNKRHLNTADIGAAMCISADKAREMCESGRIPAMNLNEDTDKKACWRISRTGFIRRMRKNLGITTQQGH